MEGREPLVVEFYQCPIHEPFVAVMAQSRGAQDGAKPAIKIQSIPEELSGRLASGMLCLIEAKSCAEALVVRVGRRVHNLLVSLGREDGVSALYGGTC